MTDDSKKQIVIKGAREHNLQDIAVILIYYLTVIYKYHIVKAPPFMHT